MMTNDTKEAIKKLLEDENFGKDETKITVLQMLGDERFCNSKTKIQLNWQKIDENGKKQRQEENGDRLDDVILSFMACVVIYSITDFRKNRLEIWTDGQPYEWYERVKNKAGTGTAEGQSG